MQCFRKAKLAMGAFRSLASKIIPKAPVQEHSSRIYRDEISISSPNAAKFSGFHPYSSLSERLELGFQLAEKRINYNPFIGGGLGKRFYSVDRNQVHLFKPRGHRRWFQNPRTVLIAILVGSGAIISFYFCHLENVPYSRKKTFVLLSKSTEKKIGEDQLEKIKAKYKGKILPAIHPDSVRVRLIAKSIIEAWQRELTQKRVWRYLGYASSARIAAKGGSSHETLRAPTESEEKVGTKCSKDNETIDDNWVQNLDGFVWEVLVVNEPVVNAFCLLGGKIVVFTGLFEHLKTDAEIATIIGNLVGAVATRHGAELMTKKLLYSIMPDGDKKMSELDFTMQGEADCIGLLLMASAGYDPRVAPKVHEKLEKFQSHSSFRCRLLEYSPLVEKALTLYWKSLRTKD